MKFAVVFLLAGTVALGQRTTVSLDGEWQIGESMEADQMPLRFDRTVPVPGLVHSATPPFPRVDEFESYELSNHRADRKSIPESQRIRHGRGRSEQPRNHFWYRRTFVARQVRAAATIRIAKAQFGTAVWLNGIRLGEYNGCFAASYFDALRAIRWRARNEIVVRIGAHPAVLPEGADCGQDGEKNRWTPGIYDSVSLRTSDNPVIESVQVAPRLKDSGALVQVRVVNRGSRPVTFRISNSVRGASKSNLVGAESSPAVTLAPSESKSVDVFVKIASARLWSPEDPFLYSLETSTGGDSAITRFGMREFRFDPVSRRAMLNGKPYFLRGSNITLHRFFEDPLSGRLPWTETWVRRLLVDIPRELSWNSFRFCIGPVPERWLEIADEAGLLIQNEYFYWTKRPTDSVHAHFSTDGLIRNISDWMRDNWNHPSVVLWDVNNESIEPELTDRVLPAVRGLDLSARPWDNGWNRPHAAGDPVEDHLYEFNKFSREFPTVYDGMLDLERRGRDFAKKAAAEGHARILNEYGWNWLNRDGSPTELTHYVYDKLPGVLTPEERIEEQCYLLAGVTEFWRSTRIFAGVLHFVYLTSSDPRAFTADHFRDVQKLELHEPFRRYMSEAFKPLGIYIDFWRREHAAGMPIRVPLKLVNDHDRNVAGSISWKLVNESGVSVAKASGDVTIPALGRIEIEILVDPVGIAGHYRLYVEATTPQGKTRSVRKISVVNAAG